MLANYPVYLQLHFIGFFLALANIINDDLLIYSISA